MWARWALQAAVIMCQKVQRPDHKALSKGILLVLVLVLAVPRGKQEQVQQHVRGARVPRGNEAHHQPACTNATYKSTNTNTNL